MIQSRPVYPQCSGYTTAISVEWETTVCRCSDGSAAAALTAQRDTSSLNPKTQKKRKEKRKTEGLAPTKNLREFEPEPTEQKDKSFHILNPWTGFPPQIFSWRITIGKSKNLWEKRKIQVFQSFYFFFFFSNFFADFFSSPSESIQFHFNLQRVFQVKISCDFYARFCSHIASGRAFGSVVERVVRILEVVGSIPTMSIVFVFNINFLCTMP